MKRAKPMTKSASAYMGRIKSMRCICCELLDRSQASITDVHHIREGRQSCNDFLVLPLCHDDCHQGPSGVHGDERWLRMLKMTEFDLLALVIERTQGAYA